MLKPVLKFLLSFVTSFIDLVLFLLQKDWSGTILRLFILFILFDLVVGKIIRSILRVTILDKEDQQMTQIFYEGNYLNFIFFTKKIYKYFTSTEEITIIKKSIETLHDSSNYSFDKKFERFIMNEKALDAMDSLRTLNNIVWKRFLTLVFFITFLSYFIIILIINFVL